jgi:hypothetical protein
MIVDITDQQAELIRQCLTESEDKLKLRNSGFLPYIDEDAVALGAAAYDALIAKFVP